MGGVEVAVQFAVVVVVVIVVVVVQGQVAVVPVQVDGVGLGGVCWLEGVGHQGHELAEDADAAVPEGGLGQPPGVGPASGGGVVRLHHVGQLVRVVVAARHEEAPPQGGDTAAHVDLTEKTKHRDQDLWS